MSIAKRVEEVLHSFYVDYDLADLNSNDQYQLIELATAIAQSETLNEQWDNLVGEEFNPQELKDLQIILSRTRKDIISLQKDLEIARKDRQSTETSPVEFIMGLKQRALSFLEERLSYVYCPKCKVLVSTLWLADYDKGSKFQFICNQCENKFIVNDFDLGRRTNMESKIVPTRLK